MMRLARLVLVSGLFVGWLGYLGFLVATRPVIEPGWSQLLPREPGWPLVLSRPQILASDEVVIATLPDRPDRGEGAHGGERRSWLPVVVVEVLSPRGSTLKPGDTIQVAPLEDCHPLPRLRGQVPPDDWTGKGDYLLPLKRARGQPGPFKVTAIPPSPGFDTSDVYRIYPKTPEALAQYRRIRPEE
jgi:hypothetical protein